MDAAVIFCDILVPCAAMGQDLRFAEGEGPALAPCVRSSADVERLSDFDARKATGFLGDALRIVRKELGRQRALIGFCGAPWTTASYMIEGGTSRNFEHSKRLLLSEPAVFERLCVRLVDNLIPYLALQVEAGADALQIFDSWGGALDAATYRRALLPHVVRLVAGAKKLGVPVILYVNGCAQLLEVLADSGADVLGLDWRVAAADAMFAPPAIVAQEVSRVLDEFRAQRGYIFNLGSGILPGTPVESMEAIFRVLRGRHERAEAGRSQPGRCG
jgi:uroporphyrinogen decarboxylase